jgi:hypothetical protein
MPFQLAYELGKTIMSHENIILYEKVCVYDVILNRRQILTLGHGVLAVTQPGMYADLSRKTPFRNIFITFISSSTYEIHWSCIMLRR